MITPARIAQLHHAAANALVDRNGGATSIHIRADELHALTTLALEAERLRAVIRAWIDAESERGGDGIWIGEGTLYPVDDPLYELAQLALECMSDGDA